MGDWFQVIGDLEVGEAEAAAFAERGVAWLLERGIVAADRTDCALGVVSGHPPGPRWRDAVQDPGNDSWLELWSNGLGVQTGRLLYDQGQGDAESTRCPRCDAAFGFMDWKSYEFDDAAWEPFAEALEDWEDGAGGGVVPCPSCAEPVPFNDWHWEPPIGIGHLSFTFWNWPELKPEFVQEFSGHLGHRTLYVDGKL